MKLNLILRYFLLCLTVYITAGAVLLKPEDIENSLSLPLNFMQHDLGSDEDSSGFSSDGPVVIYEDGNIITYSVRPYQNSFKAFREQFKATDQLICYVDKSGQQFSFKLKESIGIEPDVYDLPDKMFILSDIEGNFTGFKMILTAAGVVNEELVWIFGNGHVVLAGDFFDRGINVTECLWLIYKLETEAERQGGKVHFILGNHEMMNLKNDLRYVRAKYLANADSLKLEYKNWYAENSELGKWLRSKNGIEKIGDFLFMHAGLSKDFPVDSFSLTEINDNVRASIDKAFNKGESSKDIFIGSNGPLWYRGIVKGSETQEEVEKTLAAINASKMIIGHTIVDQIKYLYNNRVIAIDLDHQENTDKEVMYALWYENGDFYIVDHNGSKIEIKN